MAKDVKAIELWPCGYQAPCKVRNCKARATTIARAVDAGGRPIRQYELCASHAEQVTERDLWTTRPRIFYLDEARPKRYRVGEGRSSGCHQRIGRDSGLIARPDT